MFRENITAYIRQHPRSGWTRLCLPKADPHLSHLSALRIPFPPENTRPDAFPASPRIFPFLRPLARGQPGRSMFLSCAESTRGKAVDCEWDGQIPGPYILS
jgi:hypothetical protein